MKKLLLRSGLLLGGLLFGLVAAEISVRFILSAEATAGGIRMNYFTVGRPNDFIPDDEFGFMPVIGGPEYSEFGCLRNDYPAAKSVEKKRVLFMGDSVTHKARIVSQLRRLYGENDYEYWNAGVEGFNTVQETGLYRRHNHKIQPDLVVLSFHNNDFTQTPLAYHDHGRLRVLIPLHDGKQMNMWLFENSYLYRFYMGRTWRGDQDDKATQVRENLRQLKADLDGQGVQMRVVLLPLMKSSKDWDQGEHWSREHSLAIFKELNLNVIDLLPTLEQALAEGQIAEESPGDTWHPSQSVADRFAKVLHEQGILTR